MKRGVGVRAGNVCSFLFVRGKGSPRSPDVVLQPLVFVDRGCVLGLGTIKGLPCTEGFARRRAYQHVSSPVEA